MTRKNTFVPDTRPGMTATEKNMQLSGILSNAPNVDRNIVEIARDLSNSGWDITYTE